VTHDELIWQGITALVTILVVVASYLKARLNGQKIDAVKADVHGQGKKIDAVKETVNGQAQALHGRVDQLTATLTDAGVNVPAKEPPK